MATDPTTGLPDWLSTITDVGTALAGASAGRAQGRVAEGNANINQNNAAVNLYRAQLAAPSQIAHNAVKGDILSRAQDANITAPSDIPLPTITGGLRPSMFSPETRATGVGVTSNALASAAALQPVQTPVLPNLPQAGTLDSLLNSSSSIAGILKALGGGDGAGSSFKFGGNDVATGLKNLLTGKGWNSDPNGNDPNAISGQNGDIYGPTDPYTYGVQGGQQGPPEPPSSNWAQLPDWLTQGAGQDTNSDNFDTGDY